MMSSTKQRCAQCEQPYTPQRKHSQYCSTKCRVAAHRAAKLPPPPPIYTVQGGTNAELIKHVYKLYPAHTVADTTYGQGTFWASTTPPVLLASDIEPRSGRRHPVLEADFRDLPYPDDHVDLCVLDPPYATVSRNTDAFFMDHQYRIAKTLQGHDQKMIMQLYADGMKEAKRVTRKGGQLWVKTKDVTENGKQVWSHIEIYNAALALGLYPRDMFIFIPSARPRPTRVDFGTGRQRHARHSHSYLWIFDVVKK